MPGTELQSLAERFRVRLVPREVRERSLLHNDAGGNWKFAHRSLMEYFLVKGLSGERAISLGTGQPWTDQMCVFATEMLLSGECKRLPGADLHGVDLKAVDLSDVDLSGANLSRAKFDGSILRSANLRHTNLSGAHLLEANLDFANLSGACLDTADVSGLNLTEVRGLTLVQAIAATADGATIWPKRTLTGHSGPVHAVR